MIINRIPFPTSTDSSFRFSLFPSYNALWISTLHPDLILPSCPFLSGESTIDLGFLLSL